MLKTFFQCRCLMIYVWKEMTSHVVWVRFVVLFHGQACFTSTVVLWLDRFEQELKCEFRTRGDSTAALQVSPEYKALIRRGISHYFLHKTRVAKYKESGKVFQNHIYRCNLNLRAYIWKILSAWTMFIELQFFMLYIYIYI